MKQLNLNKGHRQRLKSKYIDNGDKSFTDYELLELLLTYVIPRKDTKPIAKLLIKKFGSFAEVLNQPIDKIKEIEGIGLNISLYLKLLHSTITRYFDCPIKNKIIISTPADISKFIKIQLSGQEIEVLLVLYLNDINCLLHYQTIQTGTINKLKIYPRNIIKIALEKNSTKVILIHNHPSGQPIPSDSDFELHNKIVSLCKEFDIKVIDHIIYAEQKIYSITTGKLL